jgi:hypothetical protein
MILIGLSGFKSTAQIVGLTPMLSNSIIRTIETARIDSIHCHEEDSINRAVIALKDSINAIQERKVKQLEDSLFSCYSQSNIDGFTWQNKELVLSSEVSGLKRQRNFMYFVSLFFAVIIAVK